MADNRALDADVILAAQAEAIETDFDQPVIVATTNVAHLTRFLDARYWTEIP
jgi:hypothetical protein